jgi:hypothetical protein
VILLSTFFALKKTKNRKEIKTFLDEGQKKNQMMMESSTAKGRQVK